MSLALKARRARPHGLPPPLDDKPKDHVCRLRPTAYFRWKVVLGPVVGTVLLVLSLPIMALLIVLVRLTSEGPGVYRQARLGKDRRTFTMYKIRTMTEDAESECGAVWAKPNDPRVTRIGKILRRLHLDELPQLINVVRGDMSLIGPRPERPEIACVLAEKIPAYFDRCAVRPGITGAAQVILGADEDLDDVRRKVRLDTAYIERASLWLDIRILWATWQRVCGLRSKHSIRISGLPQP
ncbi:MAG: sugar transferase [Pirellulales bacterium]|nr:sugar transferase [Pirellulales bacterium]